MTNVLGSYTVPASAVFAGGLDVDNVGASATITPVWCAGPDSSRLLGRPRSLAKTSSSACLLLPPSGVP